jgi:hypothetical protein
MIQEKLTGIRGVLSILNDVAFEVSAGFGPMLWVAYKSNTKERKLGTCSSIGL